ncbi:polysialyltransferase family glycosyltransferase [Adhaeribacter soli]|uniref:Uncharacterized protein n=1 Tax=Adhaeribacter soli TaxID=2607655 RepID=A0A5N1IL27_9BACT|nr:polysialyltransferase family glycosyltransferase [Adhaeribacter soli]KAA9327392.1 hypothetical protein F0P94_15875 [Adhaeribacter soli]
MKENSTKQTLLIVGDYNRNDFLSMFDDLKDSFNFYFIEFASEAEVTSFKFKEYGQNVFWKDFTDAYDLLEQLKPSKVVYFFIESYNHVALNVACKAKGVSTYILEHGFRNSNIAELIHVGRKEKSVNGKFSFSKMSLNRVSSIFRKLVNISTFLFYFRTAVKSETRIAEFLLKYYWVRSRRSTLDTIRLIDSDLRRADIYISFSPAVFDSYKQLDVLAASHQVQFIGIPYFDKFHKALRKANPGPGKEKIALFVDHPHVTKGLFGWTEENKVQFIAELVKACTGEGYRLLIKSHPSGLKDQNCWKKVIAGNSQVELIDQETLEENISAISLVLGFYSTLLLPLAAIPGTVLFTFETHPELDPGKGYLSEHLVESGVGHPLLKVEEFRQAIKDLHLYKIEQQKNKESFINKWMYKFDGQSGQRLQNFLLVN